MTPDIFDDYRQRGFGLCRIPDGLKKPIDPRWQLSPIAQVEQFRPGDAVGLILGPLSNRYYAIDLDFHAEDAEAWEAADALLPETGMMDGRPGKLTCHRVYQLTDTEWPDSVLPKPSSETRKAMDAGLLPRFPGTRHFSNGNGRAIDVLGAGSQMVIPPSMHPSGVQRVWWGNAPGQPATIAYADLMAAVMAVVDRLGLKRPKSSDPDDAPDPVEPTQIAHIGEDERLRRLEGYLRTVTPLEHGKNLGFHAQQWRIACVCAEFGVPFATALPVYLAWNRASATPDVDAANEATLANAYRSAVFGARLVDQGEPVDLSGLLPSPAPAPVVVQTVVDEPPEVETADPGLLPADILRVPGFISQVMDYTLATAPYPEPTLAFCGAITLLATLAGRKVRDPADARTNFYCLALANSGTGKDHPRKVNERILLEAGLINAAGDNFASGEGIEDAMVVQPTLLFQTDEIDGILTAISKSKDGRAERIMEMLLKFYSAANQHYHCRVKAGKDRQSIDQPCLVLFGTAVPKHYYQAMCDKMLSNGFFARMLVFEAGLRGVGQESVMQPLPDDIVETARWWANYRPGGRGNLGNEHPTPAVVELDEGAKAEAAQIRLLSDAAYAHVQIADDTIAMAVWARAVEKARKMALLYAISVNHQRPVITAEAIRWGWTIAEHLTRRMLFMAGRHVFDSDFDALCKRMIAILESWRSKNGDAWMEAWKVARRMKLSVRNLDEVRDALVTQRRIQYQEVPTAGLPQRLYRLSMAGAVTITHRPESSHGDVVVVPQESKP